MEKLKSNIDSNRIKCNELFDQLTNFDLNNNLDEYEKKILKLCRLAENIYRKTCLSKDSQRLIEYYLLAIRLYEKQDNMEFVQRWHQKVIGILEQLVGNRFVLDDFHLLMEWYMKTLDLMLTNKDYNGIIKYASNMYDKAKYLYKITRSNDDLKFYVISKLMLGTGYFNIKKLFKSYHYYYSASKILKQLYLDTNDEGIKNDLISVYQCLQEISNRNIFKGIAKRWKMKILLLKEK